MSVTGRLWMGLEDSNGLGESRGRRVKVGEVC